MRYITLTQTACVMPTGPCDLAHSSRVRRWSGARIAESIQRFRKHVVQGGPSNDSLSGEEGDDQLRGGEGDDTLSGGGGQDRLFGDAGNDSLNGEVGDDQLQGGDGDDTLNDCLNHNTLNGNAGTNSCQANSTGNNSSSLTNCQIITRCP
ncbi:MAG TPA: calcium-binding protein [Polyangiaceae bacterium]|nr:calcium-binding protein [Polyangiaceae bacterium]